MEEEEEERRRGSGVWKKKIRVLSAGLQSQTSRKIELCSALKPCLFGWYKIDRAKIHKVFSFCLVDSGIPGDGRCLFRSVAHGACLRTGKPSPSETVEKELADELRDEVADEFIKRRKETEWFIEDDFDAYVGQMRQPHVWGGEPELLMSSHVLKMPISVYMKDNSSGTLKVIAEYGQEYGKDIPIRVLYHGYGHYDALRCSVSGSESIPFKRR